MRFLSEPQVSQWVTKIARDNILEEHDHIRCCDLDRSISWNKASMTWDGHTPDIAEYHIYKSNSRPNRAHTQLLVMLNAAIDR